MKKTLKVALYILLALVLIVLAYVIYVFAAYYRVEDWQKLSVAHCYSASAAPMALPSISGQILFPCTMESQITPARSIYRIGSRIFSNPTISSHSPNSTLSSGLKKWS